MISRKEICKTRILSYRIYFILLFFVISPSLFAQSIEFLLREKVENFWINLSNIKYAEEKESYIRELYELWGSDVFTVNGKTMNLLDFAREMEKQIENSSAWYKVLDFKIISECKVGKKKMYSVDLILEQVIYNDENEDENMSCLKCSMEIGKYDKYISIVRIDYEPYRKMENPKFIFYLEQIGRQYISEHAGSINIEIPSKIIERNYSFNSKYKDKILNNSIPLTIERIRGYGIEAFIMNNILSVKYPANRSKDIRDFSIFLKQETSNKIVEVVLIQDRENKYKFPSLIHCNNEYKGVECGLLYNPDMPFGLYGGYVYNKFYYGIQFNCSLGTIKSIARIFSEKKYQVNGEEKSNMIPYDNRYDIDGSTKMHHDEYMLMGNAGYFLSDFIQVNIGFGFAKFKNLYITDMESIKDVILEELKDNMPPIEDGISSTSFSWSSGSNFYMYSNKKKSVAVRTGAKVYIPIKDQDYAISVGCSYTYIPGISRKNNFELSFGLLFSDL